MRFYIKIFLFLFLIQGAYSSHCLKYALAPLSTKTNKPLFSQDKDSILNGKTVVMYNPLLSNMVGASKAFMNHIYFLSQTYELLIHVPYIPMGSDEGGIIPEYGNEYQEKIGGSTIYYHPMKKIRANDSWINRLRNQKLDVDPDLLIIYHFQSMMENEFLNYSLEQNKPLSVHISLDDISQIDTSGISNFVVVNNRKQEELSRFFPGMVKKVLPPISKEYFLSLSQNDKKIIHDLKVEYDLTGKKVVLLPSRVDLNKGSGDAVNIISELKRSNRIKDFVFLFIDFNSSANRYLKQWIKSERVENYVRFLPLATDSNMMKLYYNIADLVILPSHYESLGMVLLEANSQGIPVIANKVGGIPDVVSNGRNGYLIPMKGKDTDIHKFSSSIERLLTDENEYAKMSANAFITAVEKVHPMTLSEDLGAVLEDMLNKPSKFIGDITEKQELVFYENQQKVKKWWQIFKKKNNSYILSSTKVINKFDLLEEGFQGYFDYYGPAYAYKDDVNHSKPSYALNNRILVEIITKTLLDNKGNYEFILRIKDSNKRSFVKEAPSNRSFVKIYLNKKDFVTFYHKRSRKIKTPRKERQIQKSS